MQDVQLALIGGGVSALGAVVAWVKAHRLERLKGEIARDAAEHAAALRVASERQLEVFKLAASSAEEAVRKLRAWFDGLVEYYADTYTTEDAARLHGGPIADLQRAAESAGLFVAPELDSPLAEARTALAEASRAVGLVATEVALKQGIERTTLSDRKAKMEAAERALEECVARVREWKAKEWTGAKEGSGDAE